MSVLGPKVKYLAHFKGGPIGGTTQEFDKLLPDWRVPVIPRRHSITAESMSLSRPDLTLHTATYVPDRTSVRQGRYEYDSEKYLYDVDYWWQDPSSHLQSENARLKKRICELEREVEEEGKLREAVEVIKRILV